MVVEEIEKKEGIQVKLPNFEGPMDLLLYLIRRDEIDIYDIPIAEITKQYLNTIEMMRELDLELAGEFILMAATLIQIKVRMLLPRESENLEEVEEDPRAELVRQLLEYKRYKEVAESLSEIEERQRRFYPRTSFEWTKIYRKKDAVSNEELLKDVSMFDLLLAFKTVLENVPKISNHAVSYVGATVEEQIEYLLGVLEEKERFAFTDLMSNLKEHVRIIVTFMAILELIKTHRILVQQASVFGEIWITRR